MATAFQQQALYRKLIYVGLIVALFTGALLFRNYSLQPQAEALALREENVGNVDLSGYALRLSLTGMRGFAACILWRNAMEMQKKNEWDELELLVNSVTKLQPHFITPWLFQSWNLSYNVAVQCDRDADKYFYISRGIQLLADGERQNQDQPELRFAMGTYYQAKISNADHKVPLQCIFEMSGIDPVHRDPDWLREKDAQGKPRKDSQGRPRFEGFCQDNPRLVRRLREKLGCSTVNQVCEFLHENKKIPTIYGDVKEGEGDTLHVRERLNLEKPFPILPPIRDNRYVEYNPLAKPSYDELNPHFDALAAARAWYQYAQKPLPDPDDEVPGVSKPIEDPIHQRQPTHMTTIIFRDYPALAESFLGDRLEEEGWFDDSGWKIAGWFNRDRFADDKPAVVGAAPIWGGSVWADAYRRWQEYGLANNLIKTDEDEARLEKLSKLWVDRHGQPGAVPPHLNERERKDEKMLASLRAANILAAYRRALTITNFKHQHSRADVERKPEMVATRKQLFEAERDRLAGRRSKALKEYEKGLTDLAKILADNPDFHTLAVSEDCFELEWNYLQLFQETAKAPLMKQQLFLQDFLASAALPGPDLGLMALAKTARPYAAAAPALIGPLDGRDKNGNFLLEGGAMSAVLQRKKLVSMPPMGPPQRLKPRPPVGVAGPNEQPAVPSGSNQPPPRQPSAPPIAPNPPQAK
jgi:hypothetical protein